MSAWSQQANQSAEWVTFVTCGPVCPLFGNWFAHWPKTERRAAASLCTAACWSVVKHAQESQYSLRFVELALCNLAHVLRVTGRLQWGHRTVAVFCVAFDCLKLVISCLLNLLMKWAEMPCNWGGWLSMCCRLIRLKAMPRNWLRLAFEWLPTVPRRPLYQHESTHLGLSNKLCTSCPCHSCNLDNLITNYVSGFAFHLWSKPCSTYITKINQ